MISIKHRYCTPWKINGWNLQITNLERKMIWTKPPWNYVAAVHLQGCSFLCSVSFFRAFFDRQISDFTLMMGMALVSISGAVLFVDFGGATGGHSSPWLLILGSEENLGGLDLGGKVVKFSGNLSFLTEIFDLFTKVNHHQITKHLVQFSK